MQKRPEKPVAEVFDYFSNIGVAAVKATGPFKIGDKIRIKGHTTDFEQTVSSIQTDNTPIEKVKKGDDIGIKVSDRVRKHDKIYLVK